MIGDDILKEAGKRQRSGDWYTNSLMNKLYQVQNVEVPEDNINGLTERRLYFFLYSAQYAYKYAFWDRHPLVYILEIQSNSFLGINLHYIPPDFRQGFTLSLINNEETFPIPAKSLHRYFFSGVVSGFLRVPKKDWVSVSTLPTEKFVDGRGQPFPKHRAWRIA